MRKPTNNCSKPPWLDINDILCTGRETSIRGICIRGTCIRDKDIMPFTALGANGQTMAGEEKKVGSYLSHNTEIKIWSSGSELSFYEIWHLRLESGIASCDTSNKTDLHPSISRISYLETGLKHSCFFQCTCALTCILLEQQYQSFWVWWFSTRRIVWLRDPPSQIKTPTFIKPVLKLVSSRSQTIRRVLNHHTWKDWYCCSSLLILILMVCRELAI